MAHVGIENHDLRLIHPFSSIVAGPSGSGKTYFVKMLIENLDCLISKQIENIVFIRVGRKHMTIC